MFWGPQGKVKVSMRGFKEPVPLMHLPSQTITPCSDHHLSKVMGTRERGYVIHSPVPVCVPSSPEASPAISPHYSPLRGGEAD